MRKKYPISAAIRQDLKKVESQLDEVVSDAGGVLGEACASTLEAGGKRLRPALVLVAGTSGEYDLSSLAPHAVGVELVHMASLVHDDILDDAPTRRGRPSVHARWGEVMGIAAGDYLFSKAFDVLASSALEAGPSILAATSIDLTEGELIQRSGARRVDVAREEYLERIRKKTASLFGASCLLGALACGAPPSAVEALAGYGENLGMAFQVYDDVLDVAGESDVLGKAVGADIRDGTMTLPMMLAVEELDCDGWLSDAMASDKDPVSVTSALARIAGTNAICRSKEIARGYIASGIDLVSEIEPRSLRETLRDIGNYVVQRYD